METNTFMKATAGAAAFCVRTRLPFQPLSTTGYVRPVTVIVADEHNVRTWSPPV